MLKAAHDNFSPKIQVMKASKDLLYHAYKANPSRGVQQMKSLIRILCRLQEQGQLTQDQRNSIANYGEEYCTGIYQVYRPSFESLRYLGYYGRTGIDNGGSVKELSAQLASDIQKWSKLPEAVESQTLTPSDELITWINTAKETGSDGQTSAVNRVMIALQAKFTKLDAAKGVIFMKEVKNCLSKVVEDKKEGALSELMTFINQNGPAAGVDPDIFQSFMHASLASVYGMREGEDRDNEVPTITI